MIPWSFVATPAPAMPLPCTFGKYRLVRHLARGGMGEVFLATLEGALGFEQRLVIKTILPELSGDPRFVDLFAAEAKTAVLLSHGNIVPIYELGDQDGVLYIAMAYVDGPSLSQLVGAARKAGRPLPQPQVLHIVRQVLEGMAYAHAGDTTRPPLVHRDLSPRNVLVERSGQVRIVDFGIAMFARAGRGARMGSAGYAAPEQQRAAAPDPRADVFSIGALLYELWTLRPAFSRAGVYAAPDLSPLPADLRAVVERAIDLDPDRRFADAGAFLEALAPVLANRAASTTNRDVARLLAALLPGAPQDAANAAGDGTATMGTGPCTPPTLPATATAEGRTRTFATRLPATPVRTPTDSPPPDQPPSGVRRRRRRAAWIGATLATGVAVWISAQMGVSRRTPPAPPVGPAAAGSGDSPPPPAEVEERTPTGDRRTVPPPPSPSTPGGTSTEQAATPATSPEPGGRPPRPAPRDAPSGREHPAATAGSARPGRITVLAPGVSWAEVRIDGRDAGHTPLVGRPVASGRHRVEVVCRPPVCIPERKLLQRTVRVRPDRTSTVEAP